MLTAQFGILIGLVAMSLVSPGQHILSMAVFAVWVAFCSATQDVSIDAYRIEALEPEYQGAMAGAYQVGWRIGAALVGGAVALKVAAAYDWVVSYQVMALFVLIGLITVLLVREPARSIDRATMLEEQRVVDFLERKAHWPNHLKMLFASFIGAVICPFVDFVSRNRKWALVILLFIGVYRISDITMAIMANPFYLDMGFTIDQIANVTKIYGLVLSIVGAIVGGLVVTRYGVMRPLLIGAILVSATNLLFSYLATKGSDIYLLTLVISADNFSGGFAGSAFIAYLSRLTNVAYTATQYALFSSLMTLPAKFISGFSGLIVDANGYVFFFIYAALLGIPAILLVLFLMRHLNLDEAETAAVSAKG
jgi:PAT family beta-lactamase induction signal transducer AmpG